MSKGVFNREMKGLNSIKIIREYCDYVEFHLNSVQTSWAILKEKCKHMRFIYDDFVYFTIDAMVQGHDVSKMSADEFIQYAEWFKGPYGAQWESLDVEHESIHKAAADAFTLAWDHHQTRNPHHWQNWTAIEMVHHPYEKECHCVCMVIDWMAMGLKFGDTAEEYYEAHKDEIELPEWAVAFLGEIFEALRGKSKG